MSGTAQDASQLRAWVSMTSARIGKFVARTGGAHLRAQDSQRRPTSERKSHLPVARDTHRKTTDYGTPGALVRADSAAEFLVIGDAKDQTFHGTSMG